VSRPHRGAGLHVDFDDHRGIEDQDGSAVVVEANGDDGVLDVELAKFLAAMIGFR
jgi:hypothetical protein